MGLQTRFIACQKASFRHDYLCHYLPLSAGKDTFSHSLLKFKRRIQPDLDAWIDCSLQELKVAAPSPDTIIVRALHHQETILGPRTCPDQHTSPGQNVNPGQESSFVPGFSAALDLLGEAIAGRFECRYLPSLLSKSRPTQSCKWLSREQRMAEQKGVYCISSASLPAEPPPAFLLIDDILTTGTTMRVVIGAVRHRFPRCPIRIFTLARSDHDPALNHSSPLRGQTYRLDEGSTWIVAEEDEEWPDEYSIETLKNWISANSF